MNELKNDTIELFIVSNFVENIDDPNILFNVIDKFEQPFVYMNFRSSSIGKIKLE